MGTGDKGWEDKRPKRQAELNCWSAELNWIGLDWIELNWIELNWSAEFRNETTNTITPFTRILSMCRNNVAFLWVTFSKCPYHYVDLARFVTTCAAKSHYTSGRTWHFTLLSKLFFRYWCNLVQKMFTNMYAVFVSANRRGKANLTWESKWILTRILRIYCPIWMKLGTRGVAVGWGTVLHAARSRVRFQIMSLEFLIDIILPAALWPEGRLSLQQKWVPGVFTCGITAAGV